ncbi:MAG: bifunctional folylpolyglutamate synthase/dihydrofolate synthase [Phycisphaerales bacterium]
MSKARSTSAPKRTAALRRSAGAPSQVEAKPRAAPLPPINTPETARHYLLARTDLERIAPTPATRDQYKLDRMVAILEALDNPQDSVRCIHVAGTKGKGSVCEMVAACLEASGYAVGLYTSPHLLDMRERVRINRKPVSESEFVALTKRVAKAAASVAPTMGEATFFELLTAIGFLHFAEQAVDVAVIEVGLGGRLDCTNVITPEVAAIATIGLDHTQILGDKIEEIAAQKAGIFKPGVPALVIQQDAKVLNVFRQVAQEVGAPLQVVGNDIEFSYRFEWASGGGAEARGGRGAGAGGQCARVNLTTERSNYEHVPVPLKGEHQALNCGLALAILDKLSERGFACPEAKVLRGLESVSLPGRFEMALQSPRLLLDVAHNPDSMRALMKTIGACLQYDSLIVVFGCAADKDVNAMLRSLAAGADKVIFTRATGNARAMDPADLQQRYSELGGKMSQATATLREALDLAGRAVGRGDLICVAGSFYLVGETKRLLAEAAARRAAAGPAKR